MIAKTMKENFEIYMPAIFPKLLEGALIEIEFQAESANLVDTDYDKSRFVKKTFDLGMLGGL